MFCNPDDRCNGIVQFGYTPQDLGQAVVSQAAGTKTGDCFIPFDDMVVI
ncbi:MAG: hypothetical protein ACU0DW_04290 [Shimia sp.]